jgi:hypothetical protein
MSVRFVDIILRVLRLEVPYTIFALQTSVQPLFGGGEKNPLVEVTVNCKVENSEDFCPQLRPRIRSLLCTVEGGG